MYMYIYILYDMYVMFIIFVIDDYFLCTFYFMIPCVCHGFYRFRHILSFFNITSEKVLFVNFFSIFPDYLYCSEKII